MVIHDDAHDQVLVAFNIWDVTQILSTRTFYTEIHQKDAHGASNRGAFSDLYLHNPFGLCPR
jgi:hypothetical protein